MRLTIGKQLVAALVTVAVIFAGISTYIYVTVNDVEKGYDGLLNRSAPLVFEVKDVQTELYNQSAQVRAYLATGDKQSVVQYQESKARMNKLFDSLGTKLTTPEGKQQLQEVKTAVAAYQKVADESLVIRDSQGQAAALNSIAQAKNVVAAADKTIGSYVKFLIERMDLRTKQNAERISDIHRNMFIATGCVVLFALLVGIYLSRRIGAPLARVADEAKRIADGDLRTEKIAYAGNDEISDLIGDFEKMAANLQGLVTQVTKSSQELATASEHLNASAEQSAQASGQVAQSVTEVAEGTATQVSHVEQAVGVVQQMAEAIDHIAVNASEISGRSAETARSAEEGQRAAEQANSQMGAITTAVKQSADVMQKLGEGSKQIGEIVNVISGIAGQTNLLALNAAIEAARAGEQGRGFAVVAEEVRKLAEQSQEAAAKIATLIGEIQADTDNALHVMNQGTAEVERGTEVIARTGEQFIGIVGQVEGLNRQLQEISAAAEQLSASSGEVVAAVNNVKSLASHTAGNTQTISAAAEEQSASMEEIASSSQTLASLADELKVNVGRFKV